MWYRFAISLPGSVPALILILINCSEKAIIDGSENVSASSRAHQIQLSV